MKTKQNFLSLAPLILLVLILSNHFAYSQIDKSTIGIKGGMNLNRISLYEFENKENRIGYHFGAFARLRLTEIFAFQPEVLFSTAATTIEYAGDLESNRVAVHLNYVDLPFLGSFYLSDNFSLQVGAYGSYLIRSAKGKSATDSETSPSISQDRFNKVDMGIIGGASIEFRTLSFGLRYLKSLKPVGDTHTDGQGINYNFPDDKREVWQVFIGLSFL